jgi:hypothetical protein
LGAGDVIVDKEFWGCFGDGGCEGRWALEIKAAAGMVCIDAITFEGATSAHYWEDV